MGVQVVLSPEATCTSMLTCSTSENGIQGIHEALCSGVQRIVLGQLAHAHLIDLVGVDAGAAVAGSLLTAAGEAYRRHHQPRQQGGAKRTFLFHDKFLLNLDVGDSSGPDGK